MWCPIVVEAIHLTRVIALIYCTSNLGKHIPLKMYWTSIWVSGENRGLLRDGGRRDASFDLWTSTIDRQEVFKHSHWKCIIGVKIWDFDANELDLICRPKLRPLERSHSHTDFSDFIIVLSWVGTFVWSAAKPLKLTESSLSSSSSSFFSKADWQNAAIQWQMQ